MAEPHSTAAAAALTGTAAAIPVAGIAAALGVPLDLLGWAMFGGLVAMANTEPRQPPREGLRLALAVAINVLFIWQGWDHCQRCIEDDEGGRELVLRG